MVLLPSAGLGLGPLHLLLPISSCADIRGKPWVLPQRALSQVSPYEDRGDMETE